MNIFILNKNPIKSGQILLKADKRRALKMCIEFLQASAVIAEDFGLTPILKKDGTPMKTALARRFPKPIMEWLKESRNNYKFVWMMCLEINECFDAHHLIARKNKATRWDINNGACLCGKEGDSCHRFKVHQDTFTAGILINKLKMERGEDWYFNLNLKKYELWKPTLQDLENIKKELETLCQN